MAAARGSIDKPKEVLQVADVLSTKYSSYEVDLNSGESYNEESLPLGDVYVNLRVVARGKLAEKANDEDVQGSVTEMDKMSHSFSRAAKGLKNVRLEHIFEIDPGQRQKLGKKTLRVLALACAGAGKTMIFTRKATHDWAEKKLWPEIDLLFARELRKSDVHAATSIAELLGFSDLGLTSAEQDAILLYIRAHPERIALVLDGLDETSQAQCTGFVKNVIKGTVMPGIRLIITSRHSAEAMRLSRATPFHKRVEVLGFSRKGIRSYVRKVLKESDAEIVISKLKHNPRLASTMQMPFFANAICKLYRQKPHLPQSLGNIFSSLILSALKQQQKEDEDTAPYKRWEDVPTDTQQHVLELALFAFQMLIRKKMLFSQADLDEYQVSQAALALGLLVACDKSPDSTHEQWRFSHLAMQECLAARHVASCYLSAEDTAWLVDYLGAFTGHLSTFWLLLASELDGECAVSLVNAIVKPLPGVSCTTIDDDHQSMHFLCASRRQVTEWASHLATILTETQTEYLTAILLDRVIQHGGLPRQAVLATLPSTSSGSNAEFMKALLIFWTQKVPTASTQILADAINHIAPGTAARCFGSLPSALVDLDRPILPAVQEEMSSDAERRQRMLQACRCFSEHVNSTSKPAPNNSLQLAVEEHGLDVQNVPLTLTDCQAINTVLHHYHHSINKIDLSRCGIGDDGYKQLTSGLALTRQLRFLYVDRNSLTDRHASHLGEVIQSNSSTLEHLLTAGNYFTSTGDSHVHGHIHTCRKLISIFSGCKTSTTVHINVATISNILISCPRLSLIGLSHYAIRDDGMAQLQPLLSHGRLKMLLLSDIGLTHRSTPIIQAILEHHCGSLEYLYLDGNPLSDKFLNHVGSTLIQCAHLRHIDLAVTGLTSSCLPVLTQVLQHCSELDELSINDNDLRNAGGAAQPFSAAVHSHGSLSLLRIPVQEWVDPTLWSLLVDQKRDGLQVQAVYGTYYYEESAAVPDHWKFLLRLFQLLCQEDCVTDLSPQLHLNAQQLPAPERVLGQQLLELLERLRQASPATYADVEQLMQAVLLQFVQHSVRAQAIAQQVNRQEDEDEDDAGEDAGH